MSGKRMFEFAEGSSSKFWEIWADGAVVFTRFGKIGSGGQTKLKDEGDKAAAKATLDTLIREKTGKGYIETTGGKPAVKVAKVEDEEEDEDDEDEDDDEVPATLRLEQATKFWEIELDNTAHTVRFGKLGTAGQEKRKTFANVAAAKQDYRKLVKEKTGKGYVEVDANASKAPPLEPKELARHLANLPSLADDPAYLVFADWLQTKQHPWGDLIALQHGVVTNEKKSATLQKEADKLLATQGAAILGSLARAKHSHYTWHLGFLRHAVVGTLADAESVAAGIKALLALPAAHMVEAVVANPVPDSFPVWQDWDSSPEHVVDPWGDLEELAALIPARITHVGFGGWPAPAASAYVRMPSFSKLSKAFPKLRKLELTGTCGDKPGKLSLGQLVELEVRFAQATGAALDAIATSKLPKLERLSVWLGGRTLVCLDSVHSPDDYNDEDEDASRYPDSFSAADLEAMDVDSVDDEVGAVDLARFLAGSFSPTITHLGLKSACLTAELCGVIAKSPLVKRIKTLDLSGGTLDDNGAAALIAAKKALAHLESIDVSRNRLTAAGAKKLVAALPNAKPGKIEVRSEPDFHWRFVATVE